MSPETQQLFVDAYRAHLMAVKQAWAEIDVDELAQQMTENDPKQGGCQGCGEGFNTYGSAGTLGTLGSIGGTAGSFGTLGTAACHVVEPEDDPANEPASYSSAEST